MNKKSDRFQEIDVLRGFASVLVVIFHFTINLPKNYLVKLGTTGVDLFFIISGFVIFFSINKVKSGKEFVINRFSRLYPTYWSSVFLTFILIILRSVLLTHKYDEINTKSFLANLTMFQFYLRQPDLDGPYWTLIIELIFYGLILLIFKMNMLKKINSIFIVIIIILLLIEYLQKGTMVYKVIFFGIPFFQFAPLFFAGILFYKLKTFVSGSRLYLYLLLCITLMSQILLFGTSGRSRNFISIQEYSFCLIAFYGILLMFSLNKISFIVNPVFNFFGKISYALYLNHQFLGLYFLIPIFDAFQFNKLFSTFFIVFPLCIFTAFLITNFIEIPYNKKLREYLKLKFNS